MILNQNKILVWICSNGATPLIEQYQLIHSEDVSIIFLTPNATQAQASLEGDIVLRAKKIFRVQRKVVACNHGNILARSWLEAAVEFNLRRFKPN